MPQAGMEEVEPQETTEPSRTPTHEGDGEGWEWIVLQHNVQEDAVVSSTGEHTPDDSPAPTAGQHVNYTVEPAHSDNHSTQSQDLTEGEVTEYTVFTPINPENSPRKPSSDSMHKKSDTQQAAQRPLDKPSIGSEKPSIGSNPKAEYTAMGSVDSTQGEYTPKRSPAATDTDTEMDMKKIKDLVAYSVEVDSPTTSTPGTTPIVPKKGKQRTSEQQDSIESIIGVSPIEDKRDMEKTKTDIKITDSILDEESMLKESQESKDATWETAGATRGDDTTLDWTETESCIAQRTRSKARELRWANLSALKDDYIDQQLMLENMRWMRIRSGTP